MVKSFWLVGGIIGSFVLVTTPQLIPINIPIPSTFSDIPPKTILIISEIISDALSYIVGFGIGALIGFFIKRKQWKLK